VSTEPIPAGEVTVRMQFDADRQERSAGGTVSLYANDVRIGEGRIEKTVFFRFSGYAGMDIGRDNGMPVDSGPLRATHDNPGVSAEELVAIPPGRFRTGLG
jgi:arylsulfatase